MPQFLGALPNLSFVDGSGSGVYCRQLPPSKVELLYIIQHLVLVYSQNSTGNCLYYSRQSRWDISVLLPLWVCHGIIHSADSIKRPLHSVKNDATIKPVQNYGSISCSLWNPSYEWPFEVASFEHFNLEQPFKIAAMIVLIYPIWNTVQVFYEWIIESFTQPIHSNQWTIQEKNKWIVNKSVSTTFWKNIYKKRWIKAVKNVKLT